MGLYEKIMVHYISLYKKKGYTEKKLASHQKDGWLMEQLSKSVSLAIKCHQEQPETRTFSLHLMGFMDDHRVNFHFRHQYDPQIQKLHLTQVQVQEAEYGDITIPLHTEWDLPTAKDLWNHISKGKALKTEKSLQKSNGQRKRK